jgi:CSLREA domain-containing protein
VCSSRWLLPALAGLASLLIAAPAGAKTFTVTTQQDFVGTADGNCTTCSLREAVRDANFLATDDTINLPAGSFGLTGAAGEDAAATGDLDVAAGKGKLTVNGRSARSTVIDGGGVDRVFDSVGGAILELSGLTVRNGNGAPSGGGINGAATVTLTDVAVSGNRAAQGAGIANTGSLTLIRSTVSGNIATSGGGGVDARTLALVNSTVSGNQANGTGGGVAAHAGAVRLQNTTVTGNDGGPGGGRGLDLDGASATVANSVIAGNPRGDCRTASGGSIVSAGGNLAGDAACGFGPVREPRLGQLADNGGQTNTHALLTGSPAIDAGTGLGCPPTDQRGVPRPQGQACDSGAFEAAPVAVTGPPADTIAPRITALKVSNALFMVRRSGRAAGAGAPRSRVVPRGTRFRFRLSEAGGVAFTIARRMRGRRVGKRCRAISAGKRGRRPCVRWVAVRRFIRAGVAGRNSVMFSGRIRRGRRVRALKAGRYRATVRASDAAGNRSKAARVRFRVVRGF